MPIIITKKMSLWSRLRDWYLWHFDRHAWYEDQAGGPFWAPPPTDKSDED